MFHNYLKIAWRNLFRNKGFSATNILGLTIGMTCTILIALWVQDELAYDKFHKNYDNIFRKPIRLRIGMAVDSSCIFLHTGPRSLNRE